LVLVLGIIAVAIGVLINVYAIVVVQRWSFSCKKWRVSDIWVLLYWSGNGIHVFNSFDKNLRRKD
jgi:hypothetical protein